TQVTITIDSLDKINYTNKSTYSLSGTCETDGTAAGEYTFSDGFTTLSNSAVCSGGVWTAIALDFNGWMDGTINVDVEHTDAAGNTGSVSTSVEKNEALPATIQNISSGDFGYKKVGDT